MSGRLPILLLLLLGTISMATPALWWRHSTQALIAERGFQEVLTSLLLPKASLAPLLQGLSPLADRFLEVYAESKVRELNDVITALEEASPTKRVPLELRDLVFFNLIVELTEAFPLLETDEGFKLRKQRLFIKVDGEERIFGYVGSRKLEILETLLEGTTGKEATQHFLSEVLKATTIMKVETAHQQEGSFRNGSRCYQDETQVLCSKKEARVNTGIWLRSVLWEVPEGTPPAAGWPVVLHFQGSFFAPHLFSWSGARWMPFGAYEQTRGIKVLLDAGYAVITPESHMNGFTFWDTNIPPFSLLWSLAPDHLFMEALLQEISNPSGIFGPLNFKKKFATGISSGGYMTSRMAVSYQGEFLALAVASASYATCAGPLCLVPPLPRNHPPTLFLHGALDPTVPLFTMEMYYDALRSDGIPTQKMVDPFALHAWIDGSAEALLEWFNTYNV